MRPNLINMIPAIEGEELVYLQAITKELTEDQLVNFIAVYNGKRKKTDTILLGLCAGLCAGSRYSTFYGKADRHGYSLSVNRWLMFDWYHCRYCEPQKTHF